MMALASSSISWGVKPARAATNGSTWNVMAGPLMVLSIPFRISTTPGIFLMRIGHARRPLPQQRRILGEELDLDRFRRAGQVADHVLQQLHELHLEHRLLFGDFLAHFGDHFLELRVAVAFQLDGDIAGVGFGHGGQPQLQPRAARRAFDFRRRRAESFDRGDDAIGLRRARSRRA